jgi:hypothetical protein
MRTGMAVLIGQIRAFCNLGTNDYTLGTATYWADDNVQTVLDRHKTTVIDEELAMTETYSNSGTVEYKNFYSAFGNYEETTGGTAIFLIKDSVGSSIATSQYTVDYANGVVTFTSDQAGSSRYLTGYSYDIYAAAADAWRMKAGVYGEAVNFSTDNMRVDRGSLIKNCFEMADYYLSQAQTKTLSTNRSDCT